jgi:Tfp pilus assembly PilM family ATPase
MGFPLRTSSLRVPVLPFAKKCNPIGIDIAYEGVRIAQLEAKGKAISLVAGGNKDRPEQIVPGSAEWQRWTIETIGELAANKYFRGKEVATAIPASDVIIDHIKMPKIKDDNLEHAILTRIRQKLPTEPDKAMIKYIPTEDDNIMVIVIEREKINRYLAVYEKARLSIKSICIWPEALANSYTRFFGRRKTDIEAIAFLIDIEPNRTNAVICRHANPLFARSVPRGSNQLTNEETITRLVLELTGYRRQFGSMYPHKRIERVIFLSGHGTDKHICTTIAKQLELPAQMGDCLAAAEYPKYGDECGVDRRGCKVNWATAFGLSLS